MILIFFIHRSHFLLFGLSQSGMSACREEHHAHGGHSHGHSHGAGGCDGHDHDADPERGFEEVRSSGVLTGMLTLHLKTPLHPIRMTIRLPCGLPQPLLRDTIVVGWMNEDLRAFVASSHPFQLTSLTLSIPDSLPVHRPASSDVSEREHRGRGAVVLPSLERAPRRVQVCRVRCRRVGLRIPPCLSFR